MIVFVTGAAGSVGRALIPRLEARGDTVAGSDLTLGTDIRDRARIIREIQDVNPDVIYHLAGAKHAPAGESDPYETVRINIEGTRNVLDATPPGALLIAASTCKAANPETVYGATKLIMERLVLNAGHTVARFYNVREASGNVFEIWQDMRPPLPATNCWRYFITMSQAVDLLLAVAARPAGRYTLNPGSPRHMVEEATVLVGAENVRVIPRRRGDRAREPRLAGSERLADAHGIERIYSWHDEDGGSDGDMGDPGTDVLRTDTPVRGAARAA